MRRFLPLLGITTALLAQQEPHPTGNRTTPPILNVITPLGASRGTTVEMTVEGLNLANASAIYFSKPGVKGRIVRVKELPDLPEVRLGSAGTPSTVDLGPLPPRNLVTLELDIHPEAEIGPVDFRLQTPLGTSPQGRFLIEPYYGESPDREPNDIPENAFETYLPAILVGTISRPGDADLYEIRVKAGEELVFENGATALGSTLQPVVSILAEDQAVIAEFGNDGGPGASYFAHRFEKAGTYYVRVADYQRTGKPSHFYRLKAGKFPLATAAWPMGLEKGATREVALKGFNVDTKPVAVKGEPSQESEDTLTFRPKGKAGVSFSDLKLALGREPELDSSGTNLSAAAAQSVSVPVTINGRIGQPKNGVPVENYFGFRAGKGQKLVLEVNARRLGSEIDSLVEVLDAAGKPIERATVRSVLETSTTLSERDSAGRGIRLQSWSGMAVGDYVMIGGEILRIEALPRTPDDDMVFEAFGGQRLAFFDTTTEAHGVDKPVYKVQIYPPGAQFTNNGLPVVRLYFRNDDGGPGYGKDSLVHFTAPADGEYLARIQDVRGFGGEDYAYRLTVREPRPDFRLSVTPRNPNVPAGGAVPLTVTALRLDEFDGPIQVAVEGLPAGLRASSGAIAPGQDTVTLLLSADEGARLDQAIPMQVAGRARIGGRTVEHVANPEDKLKLISLMPKADVVVTAETREIVLEPGGTAEVTVAIQRQNNFGGRVPIEVRNLPPRVRVLDVGLNGVLLNETETRRSVTLEALPTAEPVEQLIYVSGMVETRSPLQTSYAAPQPIVLKVRGGTQKSELRPPAGR